MSALSSLQLHFTVPDPASLTTVRKSETKLGQLVQRADLNRWNQSIEASDAKFVWIGLAEDIGVRANGGVGGAQTAPEAGLKALLNIQNQPEVNGTSLLIGGLLTASIPEDASLDALREAVVQIDAEVTTRIRTIVASGKIPVVMGGGHNNCYGLLRGTSEAIRQPVAALNLDAHSDFRQAEGRHSGNGFRYAYNEGYLKKYVPICLHRNYNDPALVAELMATDDFLPSFYEDVFLSGTDRFEDTLTAAFDHSRGFRTGLELDLDCIEGMLSSAMTPSGLTMREARRYVCRAAAETTPAYLHLTEGVVQRSDGLQSALTAKALAYLASDFMRRHPVPESN
ncbi:MAG: arginase [Sphingobacteriales bacterium]|nr:MAG: arginase [Sphingobacteriales bacterium]